MWVYDRETLAFLAVNDAAVERYGYSQEEFLALTIRDIRPPEEIPVLLETLALGGEGFGEGGPQRHRKKDGTVIDVSVAGHALTFEGRLAKLVVAEDVTARRRTERRLRTLSECVLGFGVEARENIQRLVEVCGEELGATWALYTRVEEGTLRHWGRWGTPEDLVISAVAEDHLCSEVIRRGGTEPVVIRDLAENARAQRDPTCCGTGCGRTWGTASWWRARAWEFSRWSPGRSGSLMRGNWRFWGLWRGPSGWKSGGVWPKRRCATGVNNWRPCGR
jgi:PAS domain S-box-containing protein